MIECYWDNRNATKVVRLDYFNPVNTWDEYIEANERAYDMVREEKDSTVHILHNPGDASMPSGNALMYIRRVVEMRPDNTGLFVMVITNLFARHITSVITKITVSADNMHIVKSLDEAYETIDNYSA